MAVRLAVEDVARLLKTGIDIVEPLIVDNARRHATANRRFLCLDMTRADLPTADLILCRDGLVHLSFADASAAMPTACVVLNLVGYAPYLGRRRSRLASPAGASSVAAGLDKSDVFSHLRAVAIRFTAGHPDEGTGLYCLA